MVVAAGGSSATLTPGQATSVGGQAVTAPSAGGAVVIGTGNSAVTVAPSPPGSTGNSAIQDNVPGNAQTPAAVITVGGTAIPANSASQFVVGSQTLVPGGAAITSQGTTFSLASGGSALVVNGQTTPVAQPVAPAVTLGGQAVATPVASGAFVLQNGHTLAPGGSAVVLSGTTYSLAPSAGSGKSESLVVNGVTTAVPAVAATAAPVVTLGGQAVATPVASGAYVLQNGQTLSPGGSAVVVSGTTYSLAPSGSPGQSESLVVNGVTTALPTAASTGGSSISEYIIGGSTIAPGGSVVVAGTTYSLPATGAGIVVNGVTMPNAAPGSPITIGNVVATPTVVPASAGGVGSITLGSQTLQYSAAGSNYIFSSQTLAPGQQITVSGETLSLGPSGVLVADGSLTRTLQQPATVTGVLAVGSGTVAFTEIGSDVVIGGNTLAPGSTMIVNGETLSLLPGGTQIVEVSGSRTSTLGLKSTGAVTSMGSLNASGPSATAGAQVTSTKSGASRLDIGALVTLLGVVVAVGLVYA